MEFLAFLQLRLFVAMGWHMQALVVSWYVYAPVSYTHLDVYKRQGQTNSAYGWQAHMLAHQGRIAAAHEQFDQGEGLSLIHI